jgi:hypothetical protein
MDKTDLPNASSDSPISTESPSPSSSPPSAPGAVSFEPIDNINPKTKGKIRIKGDLGLPKLNPLKKPGRRKGHIGNGSDAEAERIRQQAVVMHGLGVTEVSIAEQLGISRARVMTIIKDDLKTNKNGLRDLQQKALAEHFPHAKALAGRLIGLLDKGATLYDKFAGTPRYEQGPTLREVTYAYEAVAKHIVYPNPFDAPKTSLRSNFHINLKDPAALKELFAAMRGDKEVKTIEATLVKEEKP